MRDGVADTAHSLLVATSGDDVFYYILYDSTQYPVPNTKQYHAALLLCITTVPNTQVRGS